MNNIPQNMALEIAQGIFNQIVSNHIDTIDLNRDEFRRIEVICSRSVAGMSTGQKEQILQICKRSQERITQTISVIRQRDEREALLGRVLTFLAQSIQDGEMGMLEAQELYEAISKRSAV